MKTIAAFTILWGRKFVDIFTNYCAPTLLADGNLEQISKICRLKFWIMAGRHDIDVMSASIVLRKIMDIADVEFFTIPDDTIKWAMSGEFQKSSLMSFGHRFFIDKAKDDDAGIIIIIPDNIFPANSFKFVAQSISDGRRAVTAPFLGVVLETFSSELALRIQESGGKFGRYSENIMSIEHDVMLDMCFKNAHPLFECNHIDSDEFCLYPSTMYWPLGGGDGFVFKSWHPMPTFLHPRLFHHMETTVDNDLLCRALAVSDYADVAHAAHSREHLQIEIASWYKFRWPPIKRKANPRTIASWALMPMVTNSFGRYSVRHNYWIYKGGYKREWNIISDKADKFVDDIFIEIDKIKLGISPPEDIPQLNSFRPEDPPPEIRHPSILCASTSLQARSPAASAISIIMPTTRPDLASQTLECIMAGSGEIDFEIIVVSPEKWFEGKRIRHVPETTREGLFAAARGDILVTMPDDQLPDPGWLSGLAEHIAGREALHFPFAGSLHCSDTSHFGTVYGFYYPFFPVMSRRSIEAIGGWISREYVTDFGGADLGLRVWDAGGRCELLRSAIIRINRNNIQPTQPVDEKGGILMRDFEIFKAKWHDKYGEHFQAELSDIKVNWPLKLLVADSFDHGLPPIEVLREVAGEIRTGR